MHSTLALSPTCAVYLLVGTLALTTISTYIWAVARRDVYPWLPYISDTGTLAPERSLLSLGLAACTIFGLVVVWYRFKHLAFAASVEGAPSQLGRANYWGLVLGSMASIGMTVVGCFQETEILPLHLLGAFMTFGIGVLYCVVQTWISFKLATATRERAGLLVAIKAGLLPRQQRLARIRLLITVLSFVVAIASGAFGTIGYHAISKNRTAHGRFSEQRNCSSERWTGHPSTPGAYRTVFISPCRYGWAWHTASAAMEWLLGTLFALYFLSFIPDFRQFRVVITGGLVGSDAEVPLLSTQYHSIDKSKVIYE